MSSGPAFYVSTGAEPVGPLSFGELRGRLRAGEWGEEAFMWTDGMSDWQRIGDSPGLMAEIRARKLQADTEFVREEPPAKARAAARGEAARAGEGARAEAERIAAEHAAAERAAAERAAAERAAAERAAAERAAAERAAAERADAERAALERAEAARAARAAFSNAPTRSNDAAARTHDAGARAGGAPVPAAGPRAPSTGVGGRAAHLAAALDEPEPASPGEPSRTSPSAFAPDPTPRRRPSDAAREETGERTFPGTSSRPRRGPDRNRLPDPDAILEAVSLRWSRPTRGQARPEGEEAERAAAARPEPRPAEESLGGASPVGGRPVAASPTRTVERGGDRVTRPIEKSVSKRERTDRGAAVSPEAGRMSVTERVVPVAEGTDEAPLSPRPAPEPQDPPTQGIPDLDVDRPTVSAPEGLGDAPLAAAPPAPAPARAVDPASTLGFAVDAAMVNEPTLTMAAADRFSELGRQSDRRKAALAALPQVLDGFAGLLAAASVELGWQLVPGAGGGARVELRSGSGDGTLVHELRSPELPPGHLALAGAYSFVRTRYAVAGDRAPRAGGGRVTVGQEGGRVWAEVDLCWSTGPFLEPGRGGLRALVEDLGAVIDALREALPESEGA